MARKKPQARPAQKPETAEKIAAKATPAVVPGQQAADAPAPLWHYALILAYFAVVLLLGILPYLVLPQYRADNDTVVLIGFLILVFVTAACLLDAVADRLLRRAQPANEGIEPNGS